MPKDCNYSYLAIAIVVLNIILVVVFQSSYWVTQVNVYVATLSILYLFLHTHIAICIHHALLLSYVV